MQVPENRAELLIRLDEPEQIYFRSHWLTKEARIVAAFTAEFPNLGCSGTSRNELLHRVLKEWLDPKYRLDRATEFLMDQMIRRILEEENRSCTAFAVVLDRIGFTKLIIHITQHAINHISPEWTAA